jgi:hypothetical protein
MRDELYRNNTEFTQPAKSSIEPLAEAGDTLGLPREGSEPRAVARWEDVPKLGATTNYGPQSSLPDSVDGSSLVQESLRRCENILSPADRGEQ